MNTNDASEPTYVAASEIAIGDAIIEPGGSFFAVTGIERPRGCYVFVCANVAGYMSAGAVTRTRAIRGGTRILAKRGGICGFHVA